VAIVVIVVIAVIVFVFFAFVLVVVVAVVVVAVAVCMLGKRGGNHASSKGREGEAAGSPLCCFRDGRCGSSRSHPG